MAHFAEIWCKLMHTSLMWPTHGHYQCRTCGREYPVVWECGAKTGGTWRPDAPVFVAR